MTDEIRLRKIYAVINEGWKLFKRFTGTPNSDAKWDAIIAKAGRIETELVNGDTSAKVILDGFVRALEMEDKEAREHGKVD